MTSGNTISIGELRFTVPSFTKEHLEANERAWAETQAANARAARTRRAVAAGIPSRYLDARLTEVEPCDRLMRWVQAPSDGLILTGVIGVGKTHLACATMNEYMEKHGCSGRFITSIGYMDACISDTETNCFTPKILVLDDLGKEKPGEYFTGMLFRLIDERMATNRKTIITTNYSGQGLLNRLITGADDMTAKALSSRLRTFTVIRVEGADRRG